MSEATLPCPGPGKTKGDACGNPIPAIPGTNTVCLKCGSTVHVYQKPTSKGG